MAEFQSKFHKILSNLLEERGVSQKWLSDRTGLSEASISRYLNGKSDPCTIESLYSIATALNVSVDYLVGFSSVSEKQELTNEEKLLINCYRRASADDREIIRLSLRKYLNKTEKLFTQTTAQSSDKKTG